MRLSGRILVVGDVMTDIVVVPEGPLVPGSDRRAEIRRRPGGSGANQAAWLGHLGVETVFAARVGAGEGKRWAAHFAALGVVPALAEDGALPSGVLVTLVGPDGERSFLTDRGANLNLSPEDLPDGLLEGTGMLLVSGYSLFVPGPRSAVLGLMARARARGVPIGVDPASAGFLAETGAEAFLGWTRGAAILFANAEEARLLAGSADTETQMRRLGADFGCVVVKQGALGAALGGAAGTRLALPAVRAAMRDSTGAGDAFAAGFLAASWRGAGEAEALRAGIEAGARAVAVIGGQPAQ